MGGYFTWYKWTYCTRPNGPYCIRLNSACLTGLLFTNVPSGCGRLLNGRLCYWRIAAICIVALHTGQHTCLNQLHMLPLLHQLLSKKVVHKTSDTYSYLLVILWVFITDCRAWKIISVLKCSTSKGLLISDNSRVTDIIRRVGSLIKMLSKD